MVYVQPLYSWLLRYLWHFQIGDWVIINMEDTLKDDYGVEMENVRNRLITYSWDKAQRDVISIDRHYSINKKNN